MLSTSGGIEFWYSLRSDYLSGNQKPFLSKGLQRFWVLKSHGVLLESRMSGHLYDLWCLHGRLVSVRMLVDNRQADRFGQPQRTIARAGLAVRQNPGNVGCQFSAPWGIFRFSMCRHGGARAISERIIDLWHLQAGRSIVILLRILYQGP